MKKKDLLKLIEDIPDEQEVFLLINDNEYGDAIIETIETKKMNICDRHMDGRYIETVCDYQKKKDHGTMYAKCKQEYRNEREVTAIF